MINNGGMHLLDSDFLDDFFLVFDGLLRHIGGGDWGDVSLLLNDGFLHHFSDRRGRFIHLIHHVGFLSLVRSFHLLWRLYGGQWLLGFLGRNGWLRDVRLGRR